MMCMLFMYDLCVQDEERHGLPLGPARHRRHQQRALHPVLPLGACRLAALAATRHGLG